VTEEPLKKVEACEAGVLYQHWTVFLSVISSTKTEATFVRGQSFLELALGNRDLAF
jgi:hypothetical protein